MLASLRNGNICVLFLCPFDASKIFCLQFNINVVIWNAKKQHFGITAMAISQWVYRFMHYAISFVSQFGFFYLICSPKFTPVVYKMNAFSIFLITWILWNYFYSKNQILSFCHINFGFRLHKFVNEDKKSASPTKYPVVIMKASCSSNSSSCIFHLQKTFPDSISVAFLACFWCFTLEKKNCSIVTSLSFVLLLHSF